MVRTRSSGRGRNKLDAYAGDIIPSDHDTYDLGSSAKWWALAFVAIITAATVHTFEIDTNYLTFNMSQGGMNSSIPMRGFNITDASWIQASYLNTSDFYESEFRFHSTAEDTNDRVVALIGGSYNISAVSDFAYIELNTSNGSWRTQADGDPNNWFGFNEQEASGVTTWRMIIEEGGKVGINTTAPDETLTVDGSMKVSDAATFDSTITALGVIIGSNVFEQQYILSHTSENIPMFVASEWLNISFSDEIDEVVYGISHDNVDVVNDTFAINEEGVYSVTFDIEAVDNSVGASDILIAARLVFENGTEVVGSVMETEIQKQDVNALISHHFLAHFNQADNLKFQFVADDADVAINTSGNFGEHLDSVTIAMWKIANFPV